ncbi:hypothetical protein PoB_003144500 [Plakobranchus ocellatus]|uniref:Uncharacterized protein n=1 Tax=Plakobranchus ocellatus TaxID=259542 RepID=A0AAV4AC62_9GAST|nr:hypothetical protein PoB_003144500 [Plakobranchus ocellatus]
MQVLCKRKALVESERPVIQEETLQEVSLILQKLNEEKISLQYDKPITPLQEPAGKGKRDHFMIWRRKLGIFKNLQTMLVLLILWPRKRGDKWKKERGIG